MSRPVFRRVDQDKKTYLPLLLLGDEQEDMLDRYLERGVLYVLEQDGQAAALCVVTDEGGGVLELKNLAVQPALQRRGYGRSMVAFLIRTYSGRFSVLRVGTGESPLTLPFYKSLGFVQTHRVKDFFLQNYDHPIFEAGRQLTDMLYLERPI